MGVMEGTDNREAWRAAENILCVRLDYVGDVLMTSPALRALKEGGKRRRLTLLTSSGGAAAAALIPEVDEVMVYDAPWLKATAPRQNAEPEYRMVDTLKARGFDAAVIFTVFSQSPLPTAFMCYLAGIPLRLAHCHENPYQMLTDWVIDKEPQQFIRHEVRRQLDLVETIGCRPSHEHMSLAVPAAAQARADRFIRRLDMDRERPWVVIHPGATAMSRRYPPEHFAEVGSRLVEDYGWQVIFTGAPHEHDLVESIRGAMSAPSLSAVGKLKLDELAGLIARAPLLISNNTGPVHMAAALSTPVVDLYALTNPQHTPWKVANRVLFHEVPCKNCFKSICPEGHHHCLRLLKPETVAEAACELYMESGAARQLARPAPLRLGRPLS